MDASGNPWLGGAASALGAAAGEELTLSRAEVEQLLDLARFAAHESGAKLNAPLVCYLVGRAQAAAGGSVAELAALLHAAAAPADAATAGVG